MNTKIVRNFLHLTSLMLLLVSTATFAGGDGRSGTFSKLSSYAISGSVSIVKEGNQYLIVMGDDFKFDGAPDPKVALGSNGKYDSSTLIELLRSNSGAQSYVIPANIDVSAFNEVYIWCEKYSVGLGVAPIN